ncbi:UDP-glucuronosyltransferase 2B2 [Aethina tumida]|uniref:UDP-glucuronosyltransferase 2B2 n=1 Tax=Aethina tumida TaxID=116153 RepID=UPI0021486D0A|nr:UDP-glucuronosyltransferase 2B2 [Aethina tumida]
MWKWETDDLPDKPENVLIRKWFPQQDVLGHPNITQGGLQSMEEAITNAVPMVVVPYFADQPYNAKRMVHMQIAQELNYKMLTKEQFKNAVREVVENEIYTRNVMKYSKLLVDQPITGLEKAVWWIEFTLRHKGDFNLKGYGADVPYLNVSIFLSRYDCFCFNYCPCNSFVCEKNC